MTESIPDEVLIKAFGQGDESAFDTIVCRYSADVAKLANNLLGWPGEVDDVTQDVFLAAYMSLKRFRGQCSLQTWLFTITVNKCRSLTRRRLVQQKLLAGFGQHIEESAKSTSSHGRLLDAVSKAWQRLPSRYREPTVLYYLEGLSTEEIAKVLNLSVSAVYVRLNRARQRMREYLATRESTYE
jgi:RNA polymerase sigma-70 factor (ECF subfamily)